MVSDTRLSADVGHRLLFDEACDGLFLSTAEGEYVDVNRSGHRMLGYEPGELVGRNIEHVVLSRDLPRLSATLAAVARGRVQTQIWPLVRKDGTVIEVEVLAQLLSSGYVLAVVRDVDARTEFGRQLQASEAKLRSVLHTAPDTIITVDPGGRISFINRTQPPLTPEQVVGSSCYAYVTAAMRDRVRQAIQHVFATGQFDEYEVETPAVNGEGRRCWAVRAGPQIEGGRVVAVTLCASDITEQKRTAARSEELLQRLAKISSHVPGVVFQYQLRHDGRSSFPYASDGMRDVFHVAPKAVRDDASAAFASIHPDDRSEVIESLRDSARTVRAWQHEFRVVFPSGAIHWLFGNAMPETQPDNSTLFHGFINDVTLQKQAEQARARLEQQLRQAQKMESVGQLAGGVAHDFNNLLTAIGAFAELAQDDLTHGVPIREHLAGIRSAAARGAALTQQLLAFARKRIVQPQDIDLNAIVNRIAPMIRRLVGEHIRVVLELAPELSWVNVDVGSMEQVIMNLIVNARDAMPEGGTLTIATAEVSVDAHDHPDLTPGRHAVLTVSDTGTGMEPEVLARLFEPFFTTKPPGSGTGLGLAMCHGIVKQAGGSITVDSQIRVGSSLSIYLPSRPPASRPSAVPPPPSEEAPSGHETILVVEDEPAILRLAQMALERLGYRVLCASDGVEALQLVQKAADRVDLLITDVVMPRLGGRELAERLRQLYPDTKVLYMSGYAEKTLTVQGALPAGVNLIEKPYTFSALADRIRELLDSP